MEPYVRPAIPAQEFRDAEGNVIPYGDRWGMDGPPDDAYTVLTHAERFDPLHAVARALIAYLERAYGVAVTEDLALANKVNNPREDAVAAVRLVPDAADAATLTFVFSSFPGVDLEAGAALSDRFPFCGCDACDESVDDVARRLEDVVFGIVAGGLVETAKGWRSRRFHFSLSMEGGSRAGWETLSIGDTGRVRAARKSIRTRHERPWAAWSPRL